ncbi:hypothetical protein M5U04_18680 [Xenorhabdus sp. XENO-1]|uniref:hypothetical protein n=1 Tax=Xenorhabdus bovienii TaxID=40576 RepID=UPI0020CA694B|nr:hypothetical protein [Xenorhabdus bovienii]MCP9270050.1 hypothetical protein [Xenorhabdus bovienii subsp. africana]
MSKYNEEKFDAEKYIESLSPKDKARLDNIMKKQMRPIKLFGFIFLALLLYGIYHLYSTSTSGATSLVQKEVGYQHSLHFWDSTKVSKHDSNYVCGSYSIYPSDFTVQDARFFHNRPQYGFVVDTSTNKVYLETRDSYFNMIFIRKCMGDKN